MALWTVVPVETLLTDGQDSLNYREINHTGINLLIEDIAENKCKVIRILSTNPDDYLMDHLQPGTILNSSISNS